MLEKVSLPVTATPVAAEQKTRNFRLELVLKIVSASLIVTPIIVLFFVILNYARNVLYLDEWHSTPFIIKIHTGGFTLNDFWRPHNEHRVLFYRVAMLLLAWFGGWDVIKEIYAGIVCNIGTLLLLGLMLRRTVQSRFNGVVLAVISTLLFCITQFVSWMSGLGLVWFLANLLAVISFWFMSRYKLSWQTVLLGGAFAAAACYTNSTGLIVLPTVTLYLILRYKAVGWKPIAGWLLICLVTLVIHLPNMYQPGFKKPDYALFLTYPDRFVEHILGMMWNVFVAFDTLDKPFKFLISSGSLVLLVAASGYLAWRSFKTGGEEGRRLWWSCVSWLMIAIYGFGNIVIISVSRLSYLDGQAYSLSWYITVSLFYWVGTSVIIFLAGRDLFLRLRPNPLRWLPVAGMSVLLAIFVMLTVISAFKMLNIYRQWGVGNEQIMLGMLYDYRKVPDVMYKNLLDDSLTQKLNFLKALDKYDEYIFHPNVEVGNKQKLARWQNNLNTKQNFLYSYSPELVHQTFHVQNEKWEGTTVTFEPKVDKNGGTPNIFFKTDDFEVKQGTFNKERVLGIQVTNAQYVRVYWDQGEGLSELHALNLAIVYEKDDKKYFRLPVPENMRSVRVDFHYDQSQPIPVTESLQVDVYEE
jgi:hypothetical protein